MFSVVTGASSGIGLQFATQLARDYKSDLLLISNQKDALEKLAIDLSSKYNVKAIAHYADLSHYNAAEAIYDFCNQNDWEVDILVNDAGMFFFNPYCQTDLGRIETMLNLHIITVAKLCHLFGTKMLKRQLSDEEKRQRFNGHRRKKGYILNMSSMSAWMSMPGIQTYNASKVFIYNLSKSLWYEWQPQEVSVTVMTPGAVDTTLYGLASRWRRLAVALRVSIPPEKLVKRALRRMFEGKKADMPGVLNHLFVPLIKHLPDWFVLFCMRRLQQFQK